VRWFLSALGATLLLAGCGAKDDPAHTPAGMAQVRLVYDLYNGRLDGAYADLHPAYQRVVPRKLFVACTRAEALGGLDSIDIVDVSDDTVDLPGSGSVPAKAVRVRLTSSNGGSTTFVNHEVKVGPRWRWVLNDSALKAFQAGKCPST